MNSADPLCRFVPRPSARQRLVCFPHAGGSASAYFRWAAALPEDVELVAVQYPGRAERFAEPLVTDMATLVAGIRDALLDLAERPYALFGHSMGAAVAYETALALRAAGRPRPARLIVSGRAAPEPGGATTDEDDVVKVMESFGGTSAELLRDPEARALYLPIFAADWRLLRSYDPTPAAPPLRCPVSAMVGDHDPTVGTAEATRWSATTTGAFDLSVFPGDHFYLVPQMGEVLARVGELLAR